MWWYTIFQLTASQGGWRGAYLYKRGYRRISTHSLTRRLTGSLSVIGNTIISTHSLTRRLTVTTTIPDLLVMYFNSQPHKEADFSVMIVFAIILNISTHSLTRRLTNHFLNRRNEMSISTHSLTRRLTITGGEVDDWFNISTHSLTRRLTFTSSIRTSCITPFQLTASQGGWRESEVCMRLMILFQLTASQGGWLLSRLTLLFAFSFQLTASQGGWQ